jgi:hypothetical protein
MEIGISANNCTHLLALALLSALFFLVPVLCGKNGGIQEVKQILQETGIKDSRVLSRFEREEIDFEALIYMCTQVYSLLRLLARSTCTSLD